MKILSCILIISNNKQFAYEFIKFVLSNEQQMKIETEVNLTQCILISLLIRMN